MITRFLLRLAGGLSVLSATLVGVAIFAGIMLPSDGVIAFIHGSRDIDGIDIYLIDVDKIIPTQLTNSRNTKEFLEWSPDGRYLIFTAQVDYSTQLHVLEVDSKYIRQITLGSEFNENATWSPDAQQVAFVFSGDGGGIFLTNAVGGNKRRLTDNGTDASPDWSPDGIHIVFHSYRDGDWEIYMMNAEDGNLKRLTYIAGGDQNPVWSPDGHHIAFESSRGGYAEIYVMDADGSNTRRLINNSMNGQFPNWSPDGRQIAFVSRNLDQNDIYIASLDGNSIRCLTCSLLGNESYPDWRP